MTEIVPFWSRAEPVTSIDQRIADEDPTEGHKFIDELRKRNFPPPGQPEKSTIILISGDTRSSKSTTAAKIIIGSGDRSHVPSLRHHPAHGGFSADDWKCHLSINPGPLIQAVEHESDRMVRGLPPEYLVRGSFWQIDEGRNVKSVDWYTQTAKDVVATLEENAFQGFNVILCTPVKGKALSGIRELCNFWIRMYNTGPTGWGMIYYLRSEINYKSASRPEIRKPHGWAPWLDTLDPRDNKLLREWKQLYDPIKAWNAHEGNVERRARWQETRTKQTRKRAQLVNPTRSNPYVS